MKGSEKQIKWAEDIQAKALEQITETAAIEYAKEEGEELNMEIFKEYREKIETCEDARWFIDHAKFNLPEEIFYWMEDGDEDTILDSKEALGI